MAIRSFMLAGCAGLALGGAAFAQNGRPVHFNIPSEDLGDALNQAAQQGQQEIVFDAALARGKRAPAIQGDMTLSQALDALLKDTGLTYRFAATGPIVIEAAKVKAGDAAPGPAPGPSESIDALQEVVVTARKRVENVEKISVAVNVVNSDQIERTHSITSADLVSVLPSVDIQNGGSAANSSFVIRGIGTFSFSVGAEPSVSTMVDGVVLARSGMAFMDLVDIDHVEVLRGPQGTLFGKNASAGLIHIITKDPSSEPTMDFMAAAIERGEYHAGFTVSAPVTDTLGLRLTGSVTNDQGFTHNVYDDKWEDGRRGYLFRGVAKWEPTSDLTIRLRSDISSNNASGPLLVLRSVDANLPGGAAVLANQLPVVPSTNNNEVNDGQNSITRDRAMGHSLQVDWSHSDYLVTSITAFREWDEYENADDFPGAVNLLQISQPEDTNLHQWSEELRLTSPAEQFLTYVVGGFFYDEKTRFASNTNENLSSLIGLPLGLVQYPSSTHFEDRNYAAFGEATAHFTNYLRLVGGARFTHDRISYDYTQGAVYATSFGAVIYPEVAPEPIVPFLANSASKGHATFKSALEWDVLPTALAYFSFAQGYKGPAFSLEALTQPSILNRLVQPETSNAYELGLKSTWFERRLILNLDGFYTKYQNFQAQTVLPGPIALAYVLQNVAQAHTAGVELDIAARPASRLDISAGATLMQAKFDSYPNGPCDAPELELGACSATGIKNLTGGRLPFTPTFKGYIAADYAIPLRWERLSLVLGANYHYQTQVLFDVSQDPGTIQKGYGILDLSGSLVEINKKYSIDFFVKNVLGQHFVDAIAPIGSPVAPGGYLQILDKYAERRVGIALRYHFE
jgi:iron complex outermembrane receptor protein